MDEPKWTWATAQLKASIKDAKTANRILENGTEYGEPISLTRQTYLEGVVSEGEAAVRQLREMGYVVEDP